MLMLENNFIFTDFYFMIANDPTAECVFNHHKLF